MPGYLMSWNAKDQNATEDNYQSSIINLLIDLNAKHVSSRVANTVFFTTEIRIHALQMVMEEFKESIYYHIAQVAVDDTNSGITRRHTNEELKESFDSAYQEALKRRG